MGNIHLFAFVFVWLPLFILAAVGTWNGEVGWGVYAVAGAFLAFDVWRAVRRVNYDDS
jgi:hypothetical protein